MIYDKNKKCHFYQKTRFFAKNGHLGKGRKSEKTRFFRFFVKTRVPPCFGGVPRCGRGGVQKRTEVGTSGWYFRLRPQKARGRCPYVIEKTWWHVCHTNIYRGIKRKMDEKVVVFSRATRRKRAVFSIFSWKPIKNSVENCAVFKDAGFSTDPENEVFRLEKREKREKRSKTAWKIVAKPQKRLFDL